MLLDRSEAPETGSAQFNTLSPVTYALNKADAENLPWVIMLQGDRVRLYSTGVGVGVGRRGRTETISSASRRCWPKNILAICWLLFSADALKTNGAVDELLDQSRRLLVIWLIVYAIVFMLKLCRGWLLASPRLCVAARKNFQIWI